MRRIYRLNLAVTVDSDTLEGFDAFEKLFEVLVVSDHFGSTIIETDLLECKIHHRVGEPE